MSAKKFNSIVLPQLLPLLAGVLILRVTFAVVLNYRDYLPPNFESDFLQDREQYFWKGYHWAFYTHLASGPMSLILGMILISAGSKPSTFCFWWHPADC
jgi:hypothetical protein